MQDDPRLDQLARLMLHHALNIKRGEAFHITADMGALALVKALLREAQSHRRPGPGRLDQPGDNPPAA